MKFTKLLAVGMAVLCMGSAVYAAQGNVVVNGTAVNGSAYNESDVVYVPVRSVSEALGYEVTWDGTNKSIALANMPQYVTMTVGVDGYTFAKTAPAPLGASPVIKDNVCYVPTSVFSEILSYNVEIDGDDVIISEAKEAKTVTVDEINDDGFVVTDSEYGTVILAIGDETEFITENGDKADKSSVAVGDEIKVVYGDAMALSEPPVNNPVSIRLVNK